MAVPTIDFSSTAIVADPYPAYRELRERAPACRLLLPGGAGEVWFLTRYADVSALLRDARLSRNLRGVAGGVSLLDETMLGNDPPDHTRLRALVGQAFTPRRVAELEAFVAAR